MNVGKIASVAGNVLPPYSWNKPDADEQEQRELPEDDESAADERASGVGQAPGREQPLDDELIGAVGRHGQEAATQQPGEHRMRAVEARVPVEDLKFPRL